MMHCHHLSVCARTWSGKDRVSFLYFVERPSGGSRRDNSGGRDASHRKNFTLKPNSLLTVVLHINGFRQELCLPIPRFINCTGSHHCSEDGCCITVEEVRAFEFPPENSSVLILNRHFWVGFRASPYARGPHLASVSDDVTFVTV